MAGLKISPLIFERGKPGKTLDLGCGICPKNPFSFKEVFGVDIAVVESNRSYCKVADLAIEKLPYPDVFFDAITAYDFIEHVPRVVYTPERRQPFLELMNEIYRCLKPMGLFLSMTPAYPNAQAFQDPTHVNIITDQTFPKYFCSPTLWASMYGFTGNFVLNNQEWTSDAKLLTIMTRQ